MILTPTVLLAIVGGLVLLAFCFQMVFNNGNPDWAELALKYPVSTPFDGSWTEGRYDLGAPSDSGNMGKLGMNSEAIYIEPKSGAAIRIPFLDVEKAEQIDMGEGHKPICYLTLVGDFKISLPDEFVKSAGDKLVIVS
jgi:hypothetical protein